LSCEFLPRYEAFLRITGIASCEEAAQTALGWDLTSVDFWANAALRIVAATSVGPANKEADRLPLSGPP